MQGFVRRDTHGTFRPEERDFKVSTEAPLASTIQQPTAEMPPQPPALVYPTDIPSNNKKLV